LTRAVAGLFIGSPAFPLVFSSPSIVRRSPMCSVLFFFYDLKLFWPIPSLLPYSHLPIPSGVEKVGPVSKVCTA